MTAETTLPPLARDDMELHEYGVDLSGVGDDFEARMALGHVEPRRMIAACLAAERHCWGGNPRDWDMTAEEAVAAVEHLYAVRVPVEPGSDFTWAISWNEITESSPGAFPITVMDL